MKFEFEDYKKVKEKMKAKPGKAATKMNYKEEAGQPIIFDVILDISGSMKDFYNELVDCFNDIMIPSLKEASHRYKGSLRIGCLLFSTNLVPAWQGFKTLKELGSTPLKRSMLNQSGLQGRTALYGSMRAGVLWTAAAMEHMHENGRGEFPKGKIIVLTDGANNEPPEDEMAVKSALDNLSKVNRQNLQSVIGFFDTDGGLTESAFKTMVSKTGFAGLGFYGIADGKSIEEKRSSFRHHFKIFSSQAAK